MTSDSNFDIFRRRLRDTFARPRELARAVREDPRPGTPLAVAVVVAAVVAATLPTEVLLAGIRADAARGGVELATDPAILARWERMRMVMGELLVEPLRIIGLAGISALVFAILGPGTKGFRQYFALTAYSRLIAALGSVVGLVLMHVGGPDAGQLTLATLFFFLPEESLAYQTFANTDIFILWMLSVLAVGIAEMEGWRRTGGPVAVLVGGYLAFNAVLALILPMLT